jgi:formylglycine-generating enzyme required for sulfatase activity
MQLAIASRDPNRRPTPRTLGLEVSSGVEAVFLKALAVSPTERFPTMGQFWSALHMAVFPDSPTWNPGSTSGVSILPSMSTSGESSRPSRAPGGTMDQTKQRVQAVIPVNITTGPGYSTGMAGVPTSTPVLPPPPTSKSPYILGGLGALALFGGGIAAYMMFIKGGGPTSNNKPPVAMSATASGPSANASAAPAAPARPTECPSDMVLVPGGRFFMGSDDAAFKLWQPAHKVTLDTFCIDKTEVTVEAYRECSDKGDCKRPDAVPNYPKALGPKEISDEEHQKTREIYAELCNFGKEGRDKHPINCVSWELADAFCKYKQRRLPTEAEWEFAARGSDGRKFPWGDEGGDAQHMNAAGLEFNKWEKAHKLPTSDRMYDTDDGFAGTAPVGSFEKGKTKFGAYDFVGNVWEWTADWFETYKGDEQVNPKGAPAGDRKVIRGGGFNGGVQLWLNPAFRYHQVATASSHGVGFRCALTL